MGNELRSSGDVIGKFAGHTFSTYADRICFPLYEVEWIVANKQLVGHGSAVDGFSSGGIVAAQGCSWKFPILGNKAGEFAS